MQGRIARAVVLVAVGVSLVAAAVWFAADAQRHAADRAIAEGRNAEAMLTALLDQESGLRGYSLNRDRASLRVYAQGRREFDDAVTRAAAGAPGAVRAKIEAQAALAARWRSMAAVQITIVDRDGPNRFSIRNARERKRMMDAFRAQSSSLQDLVAATGSAEQRKAAILVVAIIVAVATGFALVGFFALVRPALRDAAAERARAARELAVAETRATTDALTGLPNRRALEEQIRLMLAQAERSGRPLAAVVLDIDHFKAINDAHGHEHGDAVLAAVGQALGSSARASDFVARYGGEEFVVLAPDTDPEGAMVLGEKLRVAIGEIELVCGPVSASLGVAVFPFHASDADELLRVADRGLYAAKRLGRDRVAFAQGSVVA
jgi:diguanylate cyclase (GGDEF)-like protein